MGIFDDDDGFDEGAMAWCLQVEQTRGQGGPTTGAPPPLGPNPLQANLFKAHFHCKYQSDHMHELSMILSNWLTHQIIDTSDLHTQGFELLL